jgi:hypothetical protein
MGATQLIRKSLLILAVACVLILPVARAQRDNGTQGRRSAQIIKEFERSGRINGIRIRFVLLNNDTVDSLFQGAGKYSIRARANMTTVFYVGCRPEKDTIIDVNFCIVQAGKEFIGEAIDIQNFRSGAVARGTKIDGLFQLNEKIDVKRPFVIKGLNGFSLEFELSPEALRLMQK